MTGDEAGLQGPMQLPHPVWEAGSSACSVGHKHLSDEDGEGELLIEEMKVLPPCQRPPRLCREAPRCPFNLSRGDGKTTPRLWAVTPPRSLWKPVR